MTCARRTSGTRDGLGYGFGFTDTGGVEAGPLPTAFRAVTAQFTLTPFASPVTTSGEPAPVFVFDPQVAVYPVMPLPPLLSGFANFTVASALPAVADTLTGLPGTVAGLTGTGGEDEGPGR